MGSSKKVTVGYRYFMGLHMGFCRGPVDELVHINVGDKEVFGPNKNARRLVKVHEKEIILSGIKKKIAWKEWAVAPSPLNTSTQIHINQGEIFGGDKGEGGIDGDFHFLMGENNQQIPSGLKDLLGGLVPAFRGVCTAYYDGLITSMNPYPKRWAVRLRRVLKGWDNENVWYPQKALIGLENGTIKAMNPAHILLECQTNRDWGRGKHRSLLDLNSYEKAADQLHAEGFGLCLKWKRADDISRFENLILEHIGAAHYLSRTTGLWTLRLIRDDYQKTDLPLFEPGTGLLAIDEQRTGAADSAANQCIVKWTDPRDGKTRQSRAKNVGAIQQAGGVITTIIDYPGLPTAGLAARVTARDCFAATSNLQKVKIRLDRRGAGLEPAAVFRLNAPERGIIDTVFRVGTLDYGTLTKGEITVQAVEDVFVLPDEGTGDTQMPISPPVVTAEPITLRRLIEPSWFDLVGELSAADVAQVQPEHAALAVLAARPNGSPRNYTLLTRTGNATFDEAQSGDFCPNAQIAQTIPLSAGPVMVTLFHAHDLNLVIEGSAALINDEIFKVTALDPIANTVMLARGCADTVPAAHNSGAIIWFYQDNACYDRHDYFSGETVQSKLLTRTLSETLDENLAPVDSLTLTARQHKPYPPGNVTLNNHAYPQTINGIVSLSWSSRNRLLQADQLHDTQTGNITSEAGVTYSLRIYGETDTLLKSEDGLTATSYTFTQTDEESLSNLIDVNGNPRLNERLRIELWSVRDSIASMQKHTITVHRNLP